MNQKHLVTFIEGMDKDTDFHKYPNTRYSHAENFRFIYDEEHSNGILTNEVGNKQVITFNPLFYLLGWTMLRNDLILFLLTRNGTTIVQIDTDLLGDDPINIDFDSEYIKLTKQFGHTTSTKIQAIGKYESNNIQKVYWIDDTSLKFVNLADENIQDYDASKFESFPNFNTGAIQTEIISGNIKAGRVQYTYQLFNVNGASTLIGPFSSMINISSSDYDGESYKFRGDDAGDNTGKGARVVIGNIDTNYDRIRLFRVIYEDINLNPSVYVVDERDVSGDNMIFSDITSEGKGQIDFAELVATRVDLQAKTIETKNNLLFSADVTEKTFDVEYDTGNITWEFIEDKILIDKVNILPEPITQFIHNGGSISANVQGSFQRDEIYRFGIILFDKKFKPSFVKPIADIKIPDTDITSSDLIELGLVGLYANNISVKFNVGNLPESVKAYQIVYVQRDRNKRSVLDAGIITRMYKDKFTWLSPGNTVSADDLSSNYLEYTSGEYLYGDLKESGTKLQIQKKTTINTSRVFSGWAYGVHNKHYLLADDINSEYDISNSYYHRAVDDPLFSIAAGENSFINTATTTADRLGTKGSCTILKINQTLSSDELDATAYFYARRRKNLGGDTGTDVRNNTNFYGPVESNVFIPCSSVQLASQNKAIAYGDVYINFMEYIRILYPLSSSDSSKGMLNIAVPVESSIDFNYISNPTITSLVPLRTVNVDDTQHSLMQETAGFYIKETGTEYTYNQPFNLYTYNSAYSRQENIKPYVVRPETLREDTAIDSRVYHSERKINAELEDGWLVFRQFLDVDSKYGGITKLINFKNTLYFFQPKAIGVLSVDQRELTNTDSISALTLGVGGILDRYDYVTTESGSSLHDSITASTIALYYIDEVHKSINRVGEVPQSLSNMFGLKSFMSKSDIKNGHTVFNPKYNSLLFTIDGKVLEFSETLERFTGFYSFNPRKALNVNNGILTNTDSRIYLFDNIDVNGQFDNKLNHSKIAFIIKPEGRFIQRLDILELLTYVIQDNVELQETISKFRVHNSYQNTGWIDVDNDIAVRRMRNWRINQLRDHSDDGRLKDSYFILELEFSNESNKTFKLSDVVVTHFPVRPY